MPASQDGDLLALVLEETYPGRYHGSLIRPIEAIVPPAFELAAPDSCRIDGGPTSGGTMAWLVDCSPGSLEGEPLGVMGLDDGGPLLHLEVRTLTGRIHTFLLTPTQPDVVVPSAPSTASVVFAAFGQEVDRIPVLALWLLLLISAFAGFSWRGLCLGAIAFGLGHRAARWLVVDGSLAVSAHLSPTFVLLTALMPALALARGAPRVHSWIQPTWLFGALLGALSGGVAEDSSSLSWLSGEERFLGLASAGLASTAALLLMGAAAAGLRSVLLRTSGAESASARVVANIAVALVIALLVPRVVALALLVPSGLPRVTYELAVFAPLAAVALSVSGRGVGRRAVLAFGLLLAAGTWIHVAGGFHQAGQIVILASIVLLGVSLLMRKEWVGIGMVGAVTLLTLGFGWHVRHVVESDASLPISTAAGAALVALCLFHAGVGLTRSMTQERRLQVGQGMGAFGVVSVIVWRLAEYGPWLGEEVAAEIAHGVVPIPVVALSLLLLAATMWPRRRRVPEALGMGRRRAPLHLAPVGLAFLLLPVGMVAIPNPLLEVEGRVRDDASCVVSDLLWDTYHAFNLEDEGELHDRLSESVTGDLVPNLYLDSRRRLTTGTAQGDEVTVHDVRMLGPGEVQGSARDAAFTYVGNWVVTVTVRHEQHAHDRRNSYNGRLVVRMEGSRWKIADVELTGEDRALVRSGEGLDRGEPRERLPPRKPYHVAMTSPAGGC